MDLLATETMSVQEKFMLMLLERVDRLTDEVSNLNITVKEIEESVPPTLIKYPQLENNIKIYKKDLTIQSNCCFMRCMVQGKDSREPVLNYIKEQADVKEVVYLCNSAEELLFKYKKIKAFEELWHQEIYKDDDIEPFPYNNVFVYQVMITFEKHVYPAKFVAKFYDTFKEIIFKDVNSYNTQNVNITDVCCMPLKCEKEIAYMEYHLAAGQTNSFIDKIKLTEPVIQYCGKTKGVRKGLWKKDETFSNFHENMRDSWDEDDEYYGEIYEYSPWLKRGLKK